MVLCPGDQVEIYRNTTKDRPAWVGPATVKVNDQEHGKITVRWQGRNIDVPLEGVRRAMIFATFYFDETLQAFPASSNTAIQLVRNAMEAIHTRSVFLGWIRSGDKWILTKETANFYDVFIALLHIAQNVVRVPHVLTIRLSSGIKPLPPAPSSASYSLTLFWSMGKPSRVYAHRSLACNNLSARSDLGWSAI